MAVACVSAMLAAPAVGGQASEQRRCFATGNNESEALVLAERRLTSAANALPKACSRDYWESLHRSFHALSLVVDTPTLGDVGGSSDSCYIGVGAGEPWEPPGEPEPGGDPEPVFEVPVLASATISSPTPPASKDHLRPRQVSPQEVQDPRSLIAGLRHHSRPLPRSCVHMPAVCPPEYWRRLHAAFSVGGSCPGGASSVDGGGCKVSRGDSPVSRSELLEFGEPELGRQPREDTSGARALHECLPSNALGSASQPSVAFVAVTPPSQGVVGTGMMTSPSCQETELTLPNLSPQISSKQPPSWHAPEQMPPVLAPPTSSEVRPSCPQTEPTPPALAPQTLSEVRPSCPQTEPTPPALAPQSLLEELPSCPKTEQMPSALTRQTNSRPRRPRRLKQSPLPQPVPKACPADPALPELAAGSDSSVPSGETHEGRVPSGGTYEGGSRGGGACSIPVTTPAQLSCGSSAPSRGSRQSIPGGYARCTAAELAFLEDSPHKEMAAATIPPASGRMPANWHGLMRPSLVMSSSRPRVHRPCKAALSSHEVARTKPLLCDVEGDFLELSCQTGGIKVRDLEDVWETAVLRKYGVFRTGDEQIITSSIKLFVDALDLDDGDYAAYGDLCEFLFGTTSERGPMKEIRTRLKKTLNANIDSLVTGIEHLRAWQCPSGLVTVKELGEHVANLGKLLSMTSEDCARATEQLLQEMTPEPGGEIDFWDAVAHLLGRRRTPVEVLLYDISSGFTKFTAQLLLGASFEAMYHSGTIVFGKEYWYGGRVFKSTPAHEVATFGPTLTESVMHLKPSAYVAELQTLHMGHTLATAKEWHAFVNKQLCKEYRPDNYDVLSHNCNCFSSDGVDFLTGKRLPTEIMHLPDLVLNTRTASFLRSILNGRLNGFGTGSGSGGGRFEAPHLEDASRSRGGICDVVCSVRQRAGKGCTMPLGLVACCGGPEEDEADMELGM
eukprot:TRINITY_DN14102_c1_g1_i1.p1 TRINITY_DN14102_c1_g1~~TRINITY_DN14102_c1_g1_i1.p1  ORF type:complete len:955 (+),score=165.61 TRINITY_DN14102_c1_g1_i1:2203-5067(+)